MTGKKALIFYLRHLREEIHLLHLQYNLSGVWLYPHAILKLSHLIHRWLPSSLSCGQWALLLEEKTKRGKQLCLIPI